MRRSAARITIAEYRALASLRYSLRQFLHFSEEAAASAGLTPQQHQALLAIKGFGGERLTVGQLAERLQLRHHSAVGLANRLVAHRLVRRERASADRRQVYLLLSSRGEALLEKLSTAHRDELKRIGPQIKVFLELLRAAEPGRPNVPKRSAA